MEFVQVKGIEREASRVGLGTWAIGGWMWGGTDEEVSVRTIRAAIDKGINLIDTAPVYGFGLSEEIVGRAVAEYGKRENVIIATKVGVQWEKKKVSRNSSKERIAQEIEDSLQRLKTDYIDIYQVHWPDPKVTMEATAKAMEKLYKEGKIRAIGVSNFSHEQVALFRQAAPVHTSQPPYNLFDRSIERDMVPYCRENGITTLMYGSLCRGLLSGRMKSDTEFEGDDLRKTDPKFQAPIYERYLKVVEILDEFAREKYGKRVIHLAIRWLLDQPGSDIALWGARQPEQLDPVEEIMGWSLDDEAMESVERILIQNMWK